MGCEGGPFASSDVTAASRASGRGRRRRRRRRRRRARVTWPERASRGRSAHHVAGAGEVSGRAAVGACALSLLPGSGSLPLRFRFPGARLSAGAARGTGGAMAGIKALISLSFGGAVGLMFLMLGCALPQYNQYWPLFVLFFYILSPIPYCVARRLVDDTDATSNACKELAIFLTTGIVVSAFGLPIVFARAELIYWGACALVLTGNTVIFATILGFFLVFGSNDDFSWQQW